MSLDNHYVCIMKMMGLYTWRWRSSYDEAVNHVIM